MLRATVAITVTVLMLGILWVSANRDTSGTCYATGAQQHAGQLDCLR